LLLATACVTACLLPWNAALWWLLARSRLAVELDCDARLLRRGVAPLSYGELLLEIAGRSPARLLGAPALTDSRLHLERRLLAMTEIRATTGRVRPVLAGAAALLLVAAACKTEAPTGAAIEEMDVAVATAQAEQSGLLPKTSEGPKPLFVVDGKVVSETEASALVPEEIASIEVLKGERASTYGERGANGVIVVAKRAPGELAATARAAVARTPARDVTGTVSAAEPPQEPAKVKVRAMEAKAAAPPQEPARVKVRAAQEASAAAEEEQQLREKLKAVARVMEKAAAGASDQAATSADRDRAAVKAKAAAMVEQDLRKRLKVAVTVGAKTADAAAKGVTITTSDAKAADAAAKADTITTSDAKAAARTADPLIVIDDVVRQSPGALPALAPSEILSVEVLKGEAAVNRYGARAVNGAIVITTKKKDQ
jgi:TonB-dependent SusC/RagA subfamily outer membrane receptor